MVVENHRRRCDCQGFAQAVLAIDQPRNVPQENAGKIELVVHSPLTLTTDTEAVAQAVQLPRTAADAAVQNVE